MVLALLAVAGAWIGGWAALFPRWFFDEFPGFGRRWTAVDGPYNEHLVRDVGGFFLALGVIAGVAAVVGTVVLARIVGLGWLVISVPHAAYHFTHLHVYDTLDQVLTVVSLSAGVVASLWVLLFPGRKERAPEPPG